MKTLFVDESGNLGAKGRYFVIALFAPQNKNRIKNFLKKFCVQNDIQEEVKAHLLSTPQKQNIFNKLCSANDYVISYIVADKYNIDNKKLFEDKNLLYNYLFSFLVKKTIKSAKEDIEIILDNHSIKVKSINSLVDYIKIKAITQWNFRYNLVIRYTDSKNSKIVQATDVISNAIYAKYTYNKANEGHFYNRLIISESIKFPLSKFGQNPPVDNQF